MKRHISIIFIFIFLFNIGGYYLWFGVELYNIHSQIEREIEKGLCDKDLTLIVVAVNDENEINWVESGKEFRYKGEMFDVVRSKIVDQKKYYYCINDRKEKQLIANNLKNNSSKREAEKRTKRIFGNTIYFEQVQSWKFPSETNCNFTGYLIHYQSNCTDNPNPPPKSV